jgi:SAM-dependent methyltransferase
MSPDARPPEPIQSVIRYWDRAGLPTPESSTSEGDPQLAFFDNAVENIVLARLLARWCRDRRRALDVGAGRGRFAQLLSDRFGEVLLVEPAKSLFERLQASASPLPNVQCERVPFEFLPEGRDFDFILSSGVLYFYDDRMLEEFAARISGMLTPEGVWVIRDFLATRKSVVFPSRFVEGVSCHYRTAPFWTNLARQQGLRLLGIEASKPPLRWLRRGVAARAFLSSPLARALRRQFWIEAASKRRARRLGRGEMNTVFVGMQPA